MFTRCASRVGWGRARRIFIFSIGPSSAMAEYFSIELGRIGLDTLSLNHTGFLLADDIQKFRQGDLLIIFTYDSVSQELQVLFSDTLGQKLGHRIDLILPVARGRVNMLSMHTATLALIEAVLVGVAMKQSTKSIASLETLNQIRAALLIRNQH